MPVCRDIKQNEIRFVSQKVKLLLRLASFEIQVNRHDEISDIFLSSVKSFYFQFSFVHSALRISMILLKNSFRLPRESFAYISKNLMTQIKFMKLP